MFLIFERSRAEITFLFVFILKSDFLIFILFILTFQLKQKQTSEI